MIIVQYQDSFPDLDNYVVFMSESDLAFWKHAEETSGLQPTTNRSGKNNNNNRKMKRKLIKQMRQKVYIWGIWVKDIWEFFVGFLFFFGNFCISLKLFKVIIQNKIGIDGWIDRQRVEVGSLIKWPLWKAWVLAKGPISFWLDSVISIHPRENFLERDVNTSFMFSIYLMRRDLSFDL